MEMARFSKYIILASLCLAVFTTACGDEAVEIANPSALGPGPDGFVAPSDDVVDEAQGDDPSIPEEMEELPEEPEVEEDDRGPAELFGDELSDDVEFVVFDDLLEDPEAYADRLIQTEGTIRSVCQRRGCWMELRSLDNPSGENMNVRFLDYGFFVPLDSRGALARVQGTAAVTVLTAEEVEELLAEGYDPGVVREDGTAVLIRFTASGVLMWNRADD
jgi:hypothetical protein